ELEAILTTTRSRAGEARGLGGRYSPLRQRAATVHKLYEELATVFMSDLPKANTDREGERKAKDRALDVTGRILEWWIRPGVIPEIRAASAGNIPAFIPRWPRIHAVEQSTKDTPGWPLTEARYEYVQCDDGECKLDAKRPWLPPLSCPTGRAALVD